MNRKFRFRLQAVENVRRAKEQETLQALARAQAKYQDALRAKQTLIEETENALKRRQNLASTAQPVLAYQIENEFIAGNKQRMIQADQAIFRARKFMEKALREVILAKRALRAIELLREKDFAEYKIALRKKEQKETEDLYTSRRSLSDSEGVRVSLDDSEPSDWSESA